MRVALNQPYLFPYKGYFNLIASVDVFVVGDDYKYIKGGWINRNNFPEPFTFRLRKHSDYAKINKCHFFDIEEDKRKFRRRFPKLNSKYLEPLKQECDLAWNISRTLELICKDLGIKTQFYYSSGIKHRKFVEGIIDIVRYLGGDTYVNLPGGRKLYTQDMFGDIKLEFIDTTPAPSILCEL